MFPLNKASLYWCFQHLALYHKIPNRYISAFLCTKAATASVCLSHRNSVCPSVHLSVRHTGGSVKNDAS